MSHLRLLIIGLFVTFLSSWVGLVAYSYSNLAHYLPVLSEDTGESNPPPMSGLARQGQKVYAANGCIYCHSQQVRQINVTKEDILRGWGKRPLVARDYMHEQPAFLGTQRVGPDLANIGDREKDPQWFYQHLYEPGMFARHSGMPSYRFLFKVQQIQTKTADDAVSLCGAFAPKPGYEVVPTEDAKALVAYLISLSHNYTLPEAKEPTLE